MPVMRPRFPFPMILILKTWFPVLDLYSASEDLDSGYEAPDSDIQYLTNSSE
jgi:hypothetical protein